MREHIEIEVCKCGSLEHQVIFQFDPDPGYNDEMCLSVHLNHDLPWYSRIVRAVKYIFGYKSKFGDYDEILLDRTQVLRIRNRFNSVLKKMPK